MANGTLLAWSNVTHRYEIVLFLFPILKYLLLLQMKIDFFRRIFSAEELSYVNSVTFLLREF